MNKFEYVVNQRLRGILLSETPVMEDLAWAIAYTDKSYQKDEMNPDVSYEVLAVRDEALTNAYDLFLDQKLRSVAKNLRLFWSV